MSVCSTQEDATFRVDVFEVTTIYKHAHPYTAYMYIDDCGNMRSVPGLCDVTARGFQREDASRIVYRKVIACAGEKVADCGPGARIWELTPSERTRSVIKQLLLRA